MSDLFRSSIPGLLRMAATRTAEASDPPSKKGSPPAPAITWFDIAFSVKGMTD